MELWRQLRVDKILDVAPDYVGPPVVDSAELKVDYWGTHRVPQDYGAGVYYEISHWPIQRCGSIEEIEATYTWPSADWFDFSRVAERCAEHPDHAVMAGYMAPFYMFNNIRGLETSLLDLVASPELTAYCVERICDFEYEYHARLFEAGRGRIDVTQVTDDFGWEHGLLISREAFRRYFAPHYRRLIGLAKEFGIVVFHHDDGAMSELIPDLLELGVEVLNPVQWRLPGMDPSRLKGDYGDRLAFHGGIDNQHVLPFGTLEEVEEEVRLCLSTLGRDGTGYVLAPCHNVQSITPVENVVRMYEVAHVEGRL
jgi:uroporphyrinogen decarboxylase